MRKIIAITGLKGSGKDTTADYIINKEQGWEKDSYAGILKDIASILFGWDRKMLAGETPLDRDKREASDLYWSKKLGYDVTPRNMLQRLGTEVFRQHLHPNIWVDALERKIKDHDKNIIITDCRLLLTLFQRLKMSTFLNGIGLAMINLTISFITMVLSKTFIPRLIKCLTI